MNFQGRLDFPDNSRFSRVPGRVAALKTEEKKTDMSKYDALTSFWEQRTR